MDNGRFDSLVKSLARGADRRAVLKGLFGIGGAALAAGPLLDDRADAARRPAPAPKPVTCPGRQVWSDGACVCPSGLEQCGPDCCAAGLECCDNACCDGHCAIEEVCCPWEHWCDATDECCMDGTICCGDLGCAIPTEYGCCPDTECPEAFDCCFGDCCAIGYCSSQGCCALGVCGDQCLTAEGNECCGGVEYDPETQICCGTQVFAGNCCSADDCASICDTCDDHLCTAHECA